jgi:hypothetical protein
MLRVLVVQSAVHDGWQYINGWRIWQAQILFDTPTTWRNKFRI